MKQDFIFTSESVTEGHPDKLCDRMSDAIVDHFLRQDNYARVRAECAVSTAVVFIAARFSSKLTIDFANVARQVIQETGYGKESFNWKTCSILTSLRDLPVAGEHLDEFSLSDEALDSIVARDLVTIFGFACDQTPAMMPLPIWLSHKLARRLSGVRNTALPYLEPDGKTQVSVEYKGGRPVRIHGITLLCSQRKKCATDLEQLRSDIAAHVVRDAFEEEPVKPDKDTRIFINPEGPIITGGPSVHAGLTGRKTAVDTYGEYSRHSGSALSGKDPLRVDRVGAYAARYAAKNVIAAGLASECEVVLCYSIGLARPVSVQVECFGTGKTSERAIADALLEVFDFRLGAIMRDFRLRLLPAERREGFYRELAAYGQVGRIDMDLPWEKTDKAQALQDIVKR